MSLTPFTILVGVAALLSIVSLIRPQWPLVPIAVFLIAVALLVSKS